MERGGGGPVGRVQLRKGATTIRVIAVRRGLDPDRVEAAGAITVAVGGWLTNHDDPADVGDCAATIVDACGAPFGPLV